MHARSVEVCRARRLWVFAFIHPELWELVVVINGAWHMDMRTRMCVCTCEQWRGYAPTRS